jgi:hypothetical protein
MVSRKHSWLFVMLVVLLWLPAFNVSAQGIGEDLYIGGFVSQGYLNTSENDYLVPRSVNGTAEFTDAAIFFSANPMDRLRIGVQFIARNFGSSGNGQVRVDWAYGDYRLWDELGFRAGRVKLPFGLYNEGRDVDMLRTSVFLPQSVYNEKVRDLVLAYEGAGAYGSLELDAVGEMEYHVFGGTLNVSDTSIGVWKDQTQAVGNDAAALLAVANDLENGWEVGTTEVVFSESVDPEITFPWVWGGALIWNTPLTGLRLGSSFLNGRFNYRAKFRFDVTQPGIDPDTEVSSSVLTDVDKTSKIDNVVTFSAEYTHDDIILAMEYYQDKMDDNHSSGWYGQAGYHFNDLFSVSGCYSESYGDSKDKEGARFVRYGLPDYYAWLKDTTISLRLDLTDFWLLKLEYHFLNGVEQGGSHSLTQGLVDPLSENWNMLTAKTTFAF